MSRESQVGEKVRRLLGSGGFHMGGFVRKPGTGPLAGEVPVILSTPRLPAGQRDWVEERFRAVESAGAISFAVSVNIEPFENAMARAGVNILAFVYAKAIDEEGCGAVFAAMKTWSDD